MQRRSHTSYDLYGEHPPGSSYGVTALVSCQSPPLRPPTSASGRITPMQRPKTRQSLITDEGRITPMQRPKTRQSLVEENGLQTDQDSHPYSGPMDPVTRHYYYREWCRNPPKPQMPQNRSGRLGSSWRHVKTTLNPNGANIAFIDGIVKEEENYFYPPELMYQPPDFSKIVPQTYCNISTTSPKQSKYQTSFNSKAKQGFRYWYQEPKPISCKTFTF
ncbi:hypothetical protein LOTGIDRAFT_164426 [Lottia gigantea]|uniref:Uncharacterized protein n=1 Tax=Lottia gigantea TaxID=225164 RepID=V4A0D3_LOTGI|nr:hypothetical protein LOTGIDRAFT_164426 [Lottia gigantea]ESO90122.1 hypothetical protein LOTGIDRAFT_164426 [Lottia gigantea]